MLSRSLYALRGSWPYHCREDTRSSPCAPVPGVFIIAGSKAPELWTYGCNEPVVAHSMVVIPSVDRRSPNLHLQLLRAVYALLWQLSGTSLCSPTNERVRDAPLRSTGRQHVVRSLCIVQLSLSSSRCRRDDRTED